MGEASIVIYIKIDETTKVFMVSPLCTPNTASKKTPSPTLPTNLKGKKQGTVSACLGPSQWLHEISLPKRVSDHF
jgi:hypothetical protein